MPPKSLSEGWAEAKARFRAEKERKKKEGPAFRMRWHPSWTGEYTLRQYWQDCKECGILYEAAMIVAMCLWIPMDNVVHDVMTPGTVKVVTRDFLLLAHVVICAGCFWLAGRVSYRNDHPILALLYRCGALIMVSVVAVGLLCAWTFQAVREQGRLW